jgi:hypothetical protein
MERDERVKSGAKGENGGAKCGGGKNRNSNPICETADIKRAPANITGSLFWFCMVYLYLNIESRTLFGPTDLKNNQEKISPDQKKMKPLNAIEDST